MNTAVRRPWTQDEFFAWAEAQSMRYEFDGSQPVAMTGGNVNHNRLIRNLQFALTARLRGGPCEPLGPEAGVATVNNAIRYPGEIWRATTLTRDDILRIPEIGVEIPVNEFYENMTFTDEEGASD